MSSDTKWHVGKNGPAVCPAKIQCRLKGPDGQPVPHFNTEAEAEDYYQKTLETEHGAVATIGVRKSAEHYRKLLKNVEDSNSPEHDNIRTELFHSVQEEKYSGREESTSHITDLTLESIEEPDGGATIAFSGNANESAYVKEGFAYSPYPELTVAIPHSEITSDDIISYVRKNEEILLKEGNKFGVWHDPDTGIIYLDVSVVTEDAATAREDCLDQDQIAFYDMQMGESVIVDRNATSGQQQLE